MPDFDLYRLRSVRRLHLFQGSVGSEDYTLEVEAEYGDMREGAVMLEFGGLKTAIVPPMMPSFSFGELEVDDVSHEQLEGVRFRVKDHGMTSFEVLCRAMAIRWCASGE
jgi:hypothetical protein